MLLLDENTRLVCNVRAHGKVIKPTFASRDEQSRFAIRHHALFSLPLMILAALQHSQSRIAEHTSLAHTSFTDDIRSGCKAQQQHVSPLRLK